MKVSLKWLKKYIDIELPVSELSEVMTMIGLEVEGIEEVESIKGGLKGVVVGEVLTCGKHPGADKLSLTTVNIGGESPLQIVCGAPNVAAGQKVLVATIGTTLYTQEGEAWKIKKGKIRGEVSEGMICAEDELGLGTNHDGIMVLEGDAQIGLEASKLLKLESDTVYEIGLTPNRSDATSHLGVAKDLAAYLTVNGNDEVTVKIPDVSDFKVDQHTTPITIDVLNKEKCPRYTGIVLSEIEVKDSPEWLRNHLNAIGVRPINNIVDITNFILHELGQPLHAFDYHRITGSKVIVDTLKEGSKFVSLDEVERKLSNEDLMICDGERNGMCIGGVFGGLNSGVTKDTTTIFLESAHFSASTIRKSSTRHLLRTDAAKVFEKGSDPNITSYALKRAALLIKELAGGIVTSEIIDIYPSPIKMVEIHLKYAHVNRLIGIDISKDKVHEILRAMDMEIAPIDSESIMVSVPTDKADVTRPVDLIEEILRIYGFNQIPLSDGLNSTVYYSEETKKHEIRSSLAHLLSGRGLSEMMGMSLVESRTILATEIAKKDDLVFINNTSNVHLDIMRPDMMSSGLTSIVHNHNRQNLDLKLYEFGKTYLNSENGFKETEFLSLFSSGKSTQESWNQPQHKTDFYGMKQLVVDLLWKSGIDRYQIRKTNDKRFDYGIELHRGPQVIASIGKVASSIEKQYGAKAEVFYAEISMKPIYKVKRKPVSVAEVSKFPAVRRDLALVIDKEVEFSAIKSLAEKTDKKYLQEINLFDIYENEEQLGANKKSYAVSFLFSDLTKTLKDKEVDKVMNALAQRFKSELGAVIRR